MIAAPLVGGQDYPFTWNDFLRMFPDEEACREYLFKVRWPDGFRCPKPGCNGTQSWRTSRGLYVCRTCERNVSLTAGTVLDRTRTPLRTWFLTIWQLTTSKSGTSALGLYRSMGVRQPGDRLGSPAQAAPGHGPAGSGATRARPGDRDR